MAIKSKVSAGQKVDDFYLKCVLEFPLVSIRFEEQREAAQAMMDASFDNPGS